MRIFVSLLAAALYSISYPQASSAQRVVFDDRANPRLSFGYQMKWDPLLERIIAFHEDLRAPTDDPNQPAVRVASSSGKVLSIYPLRDLPGATYIDISDVAGAPNGDIIVAAILGYAPRNARPIPVKEFLLTYDQGGTLREVWDQYPYDFERVAVDSSGDVFALGDANFKDPYPLLIKYSPSGDIVGKYLSSGLFPQKDMVMALNNRNGEPRLFVKNDRLYVWIAATLQLFAYSLDGNLLSVTSLSQGAHTIADLSGASWVRFFNLGVDSSQAIVCEVGLALKDPSDPSGKKWKGGGAVVRLNPDGSFDKWILPVTSGHGRRPFLGLSKTDKPLFVDRFGPYSVGIDLSK